MVGSDIHMYILTYVRNGKPTIYSGYIIATVANNSYRF